MGPFIQRLIALVQKWGPILAPTVITIVNNLPLDPAEKALIIAIINSILADQKAAKKAFKLATGEIPAAVTAALQVEADALAAKVAAVDAVANDNAQLFTDTATATAATTTEATAWTALNNTLAQWEAGTLPA